MIIWAARKELVRRADTTTTRSIFLSCGNSNVFSAGFERSSRIRVPNTSRDSTLSFTEGFKREQLQTLLSYLSSPVHKFYVFAGKDSGLRANDLLYLRYKHIQRDFEAGQKFVAIEFEKERYLRRKAPGRTFL